MSPKVRVLLVDDSVVVRRVLGDIVAAHPDLALAGTAPNAAIGIQRISQLNPDVIVLDIEMPGMDGIEAARVIRAQWPKLPILMCSTLSERGAEVTMRALAAGATDYIAKPTSLGARENALTGFGAELIAKLEALGGATAAPIGTRASLLPPTTRQRVRRAGNPSVIAIGSSTGGPNALATIFERLPAGLPPIVIAQHMPPLFTRMLAERLTATSTLRVEEGAEGRTLEYGHAYIAPGGRHMTLARQGTSVRIVLNDEPPENSCRPAVDVLFRGVAAAYGANALALVLTGMGQDGTRGAEHIALAGGSVIVQSAPTCVVASMPQSVHRAGFADDVVPLDEIATAVVVRTRRGASLLPSAMRP